MYFDNCQRRISEITDRQLTDLIGHQEENLWIEFKRKEYHRDSNDKEKHKREICKDVTAMANAEGGYIFIGVQEEGGIARGFFTVDKPERVAQSIRGICLRRIDPPIRNLQVAERPIEWDGKGITLVIVHVPPSDFRPHGFKPNGSTNFVKRYGTDISEYPVIDLAVDFSARHMPPVIHEINEKLDAISRNIQQIGEH